MTLLADDGATVGADRGHGSRRSSFRPELQALRALAVALVLVYHAAPQRLPGGYVGVDVFFVISGFLITAHLVDELQRTSGLRLLRFYARRIRRLLPASLFVLLVTLGVTVAVVPETRWTDIGQQVIASALYVENWALARSAVDYFAYGAASSPVQHFWSLSVEEQFYLVWPVLLLGTFAAARRRSALTPSRVLMVVLLVSFAYSLWLTATNPSVAYFSTPARTWEFSAGGLLAASGRALRTGPVVRAALSWGGVLLVLASSVVLSDASPFPGWRAALPVVGTLAVIAAGDVRHRAGTSWAFGLRPVQFLGDVSYSAYLWHWPVLVLVPFVVSGAVGTQARLALLPLAVALAWLSKVLVEDPFRADTGSRTGRSSRPVLLAALVGMLVVCLFASLVVRTAQARTAEAERDLAAALRGDAACLGAAALLDRACDGGNGGSRPVVPAPVIAEDDGFSLTPSTVGCQLNGREADVRPCSFGADGSVRLDVALVGDSHAAQWHPALERLADRHGWSLTTFVKSGCPLTTAVPELGPSFTPSCSDWNAAVLDEITKRRFDVVVVSTLSTTEYRHGGGQTAAEAAERGLADAWTALEQSGTQVVAIRDTPYPPAADVPDVPSCVARHEDDLTACALPREQALLADPQVRAAAATRTPLLDLTEAFCTEQSCDAVVGDVLVYRNRDHVTATYMRTVAPLLEDELRRAMPGMLTD